VGPTRLHVDRSFTLHGIGTVATGTLWSGTICEGDELRVEPGGRSVRVRSVQVHDRSVERAEPGQRVAVSLPGVERRELRRGDVLVTPGSVRPSFRLDLLLEPLEEVPSRAMLHHGTADAVARVVRAGERFAQLRLSRPVVAARGDRVVLRAGTTVAGGVVLDPDPPRHAELARFEALERGETLIHAPVRVDGEWRWSDEWVEDLRAELERAIEAADPLDPGVPVPAGEWSKAVLPHLGLELRGAKLYRPGAAAELGERAEAAEALAARLGVEPVRVEDAQLARFLEEQGRLVRVGDGFAVSPEAYQQARTALVDGITLAQFRDALGVGRKTAQLYLERFDADGVTRRVGDARVLRRRR
jgi:selenocysteine-specific elongation factor